MLCWFIFQPQFVVKKVQPYNQQWPLFTDSVHYSQQYENKE